MPDIGIEKAYQDRYTLPPPSLGKASPVQWYTLRPLFIGRRFGRSRFKTGSVARADEETITSACQE
jgi:hypothetical protein